MTPQRTAPWSIVLALLVALPSAAYTIVKKDGKRLEVKGPPEYRDGKALYVLPGGLQGSMPEQSVDKRATVTANAGPAKEPAGATGKKSSFSNADLPKGGGGSDAAPAEPAVDPREEADWAKRHDEEMARLEAERSGKPAAPKTSAPAPASPAAGEGDSDGDARGAAAEVAEGEKYRKQRHEDGDADGGDVPAEKEPASAPSKEVAAPADPEAEETEEEKAERLEAKAAELEKRLAELDRFISGGGGNAATVNERLRVADELSQVQSEIGDEEE